MVDVVLITGIPGAGKTSVSDELARQLPKAVHISVDSLRHSIKGGFKDPTQEWDDETRRQIYLAFKNAASLTENFIDTGFKVIVDDVVHAGDLYEEWKKHFNKFSYKMVFLNPNLDEVIKRDKERESHHVDEIHISRLYDDFNQYDYSDWLVIDNSNQTIEETVNEIKSKLNW